MREADVRETIHRPLQQALSLDPKSCVTVLRRL
jgi:hypothetical protein